MAGRGGPLGPYFRATPVPRNAKLRLSMRFRFKKGAFWISWDLPWGGLWEVVSISKSQLLMQNSIWPTGVADQIRTRGAPQSRHALIAVFAALVPLDFVSASVRLPPHSPL